MTVLPFSYVFMALVTLCNCVQFSKAAMSMTMNATQFAQEQLDYLIIGGGVSGLVVAARLTENPAIRVGVIEAGNLKVNDPLIDIPINFGAAQGNPDYDWIFRSIPQVYLENRTIDMPSGKALGGSSILSAFASPACINICIRPNIRILQTWHRASSVEYDQWDTRFQNGAKWNFKSLLPYFKRAENWSPPPIVFPGQTVSERLSKDMGKQGPIPIIYDNFIPPIIPAGVAALNSLGISTNSDPNSGDGIGVSFTAQTVNKTTGTRATTASTYLQQVAARSNLVILTNSTATKIIFHLQKNERPVAHSVKYVNANRTYTVLFRKELILAAGPIKTPQLLELSGVGNKTLLNNLGINSIVDLPAVGENLQDPTITLQEYTVKPGVLTLDALRLNSTFAGEQQALYAKNGTGAFTYTTSNLANEPLQRIMSPQHLIDLTMLAESDNLSSKTPSLEAIRKSILKDWLNSTEVGWAQLFLVPAGITPTNDSHIAIGSVNLHPFSSGSVHINSSDPLKYPVINPHYFENDVDSELHAHMMTGALAWASSPPISSMILSAFNPPWNVTAFTDLKRFAYQTVASSFHYTSTTAMAPHALGGVVDSSLKIHGLHNVRVVGASVIPMSLGSAPQTAVYAIAEKASDLIKGIKI